jgi:hypothetical protein
VTRATLAALFGGLLIAASGAAGASGSSAAASLNAAIAAEKRALKDVHAEKWKDARANLEESKKALGEARADVLKDPVMAPAAKDLNQALLGDDRALDNLRAKPALDPAYAINIAIIRKESAAEWIDHHTVKPPPPNQPPRVTEFKAEFPSGKEGTTTTYTVTASDPDGDKLTYDWTKDQPGKACGRFSYFTNAPNVVYWDHPGPEQAQAAGKKYSCPHEGPFHIAKITVAVSDGKDTCTVVDPYGSQPVPPFDPGEKCAKIGKPGLTPDLANAMVQALDHTIDEEASVLAPPLDFVLPDIRRLEDSRKVLDRVEAELSKYAGVFPEEYAIHRASELDGEALEDAKAGKDGRAYDAVGDAVDLKESARNALKKLGKAK